MQILYADNVDYDETAQKRRLIRVFVRFKCREIHFLIQLQLIDRAYLLVLIDYVEIIRQCYKVFA